MPQGLSRAGCRQWRPASERNQLCPQRPRLSIQHGRWHPRRQAGAASVGRGLRKDPRSPSE
eukprot:6653754-Pyramimonas_sp.AAC.1